MADEKNKSVVYMQGPNGTFIEIPVPEKTLAQVKNLQLKANATQFDKQRVEIAKALQEPINETIEEDDKPAVAGMTLMYDFDRGAAPRLVPTNLIQDLRERARTDEKDGWSWSHPKPKPVKPATATAS